MIVDAKGLYGAVQIVECCLGTALKENETLRCLHFKVNNGQLRIAATNLKDYSDEHIPVQGDETCEYLVEGKPFISYLKSLVDLGIEKVEIALKDSVIEISGNKVKGKGKGPKSVLPIVKSDSFPVKEAILSQATIVTIQKDALLASLKPTLKVASGAVDDRFKNLRMVFEPGASNPMKIQVTDTIALVEATVASSEAEVIGAEREIFVAADTAELLRQAVMKSAEDKVVLNFTDSILSVQRANGQMISSTLSQGTAIETILSHLDAIESSAVAMGLVQRQSLAKSLSFLTAYKSGKDGDRVYIRIKAESPENSAMTLLKNCDQDRQELDVEVKNAIGDEFCFVNLDTVTKIVSSVESDFCGVVVVGTGKKCETTSVNHNPANRLGLVFMNPSLRVVISPCAHKDNPFV